MLRSKWLFKQQSYHNCGAFAANKMKSYAVPIPVAHSSRTPCLRLSQIPIIIKRIFLNINQSTEFSRHGNNKRNRNVGYKRKAIAERLGCCQVPPSLPPSSKPSLLDAIFKKILQQRYVSRRYQNQYETFAEFLHWKPHVIRRVNSYAKDEKRACSFLRSTAQRNRHQTLRVCLSLLYRTIFQRQGSDERTLSCTACT